MFRQSPVHCKYNTVPLLLESIMQEGVGEYIQSRYITYKVIVILPPKSVSVLQENMYAYIILQPETQISKKPI